MQKILRFELAVAMKDRPKIFQLITLVLFWFCVTVIVVTSCVRFWGAAEKQQQISKESNGAEYAGFVAAPSGNLLHLKK